MSSLLRTRLRSRLSRIHLPQDRPFQPINSLVPPRRVASNRQAYQFFLVCSAKTSFTSLYRPLEPCSRKMQQRRSSSFRFSALHSGV